MPAALPAASYVDALEGGIDAATAGFTPDIVLISAGFDSLAGDPLGGFTFEPEHLAAITRRLVERAGAWCNGRVVSVLEGGYAPDRLAEGVMAHIAALA
jgi:acetoin utilization deacetylase AcuC-like enzyme